MEHSLKVTLILTCVFDRSCQCLSLGVACRWGGSLSCGSSSHRIVYMLGLRLWMVCGSATVDTKQRTARPTFLLLRLVFPDVSADHIVSAYSFFRISRATYESRNCARPGQGSNSSYPFSACWTCSGGHNHRQNQNHRHHQSKVCSVLDGFH